MKNAKRSPPTTPKTQFSSMGSTETRSEPDITTAVTECGYVNTARSKRPRNDVSPQGESDDQTPAKWKKEQDSIIGKQLADQSKLIAKLSSDIGDIKKQNNEIQASNAVIRKSNAEIVQSIEFFNKQFEDLKTEVETLRKVRRDQQTYIENLEHKITDLQHKSRSSGIELRNIPQEAAESTASLIKTVCNIGTTVGVRIAETELRDIYRVPRKSNTSSTPPPIVAEFTSVQAKQSLISAVRTYNKGRGRDDKLNTAAMGMSGDRRPVYVAEQLPPSTKKLFYLAREFASKSAFKFCWISNGGAHSSGWEKMQTKNINLSQEQRNKDNSDIQKMGRQEPQVLSIEGSVHDQAVYLNQVTAPAIGSTYFGTVEGGPPYRMPPAPEAALPGAPAPSLPAALHTHSNKFPIEREVILSSGDKNSKVPILQEARKRGRLGAVAPDTPPKALSAWTHAENQQAGTSGDGFRQYHEQYGYMNQNLGAVARNMQNYDSPKPPIPAKTYGKVDTPNNSQLITVTVETGKDNTRDAPKSAKSVSKTYHTLKDMISSKFKSKDANDIEKNNEQEPSLNNSEERKRPERPEPEQVTPRESGPRKVEQGIYGRPMTQARPEMQYSHGIPNNMAYPSPSPHRQLMQQQQMVQSHMMMSPQARSQEMLASTPHRQPQALGADALYQQYGPPGRRSALYQRDMDVRSMANFTSLKTGPQSQFDNSHSRPDLRSPQQLEREIVRQRGFVEGRRATSHPHLLDEPQHRPEVTTPQIHDPGRRNSHGNLLDHTPNEHPQNCEERESDDGGFRARLAAQGRSNYEERIRTSGRSVESQRQERMQENVYRRTPDSHKERRTPDSHKERRTPDSHKERRTPDIHKERRTPDSIGHKKDREEPLTSQERNDESASQKSADSVYHSSGKAEAYNPQPSSSRHTPNRIEDLKAHGKKGAGSGASSDYDKNGGQSSNVDSGRGSVAYSSGRRPEPLHDTSVDSDAQGTRPPQPGTSQQPQGQSVENDWVECELRHILEPKLASMRLDSSATSDTSVTPPLPPLSPSSDMHKRNSLPGRSSEYPEERRRGRESPRWHSHKKHSSKRDHHYKKHLFGLDTTDMTSTTTRSLDLSSLLEGRSDSSSSGDARAIRRQLRGLENMYAEVLQLLGVRKPTSLAKQPTWESRLSSKRRYGSMSSLPSSSVSSRPVRDKRRSSNEHRKKHDLKGINKRFQRLESHVVTLARSVAHLSSEMRTQHLVVQEMDNIRAEIAALRHMYKSQQYIRSGSHGRHLDPYSFSNPDRVKRLTKFFGDEPPLMRLFLKKLGYEKYAALLEKEKVGAAELPYVGEDKLRALGVPLGPRMRILKEAGIHQDIHHMSSRDDQHNTTTTLAIV